MRKLINLIILLAFFLLPICLNASVTATSSYISVPANKSGSAVINYSFSILSGDTPPEITATSSQGIFKTASGVILGYSNSISTTLSYDFSQDKYVGTLTENLYIPVDIVEKAYNTYNASEILYYRTFTYSKPGVNPDTSNTITIHITSPVPPTITSSASKTAIAPNRADQVSITYSVTAYGGSSPSTITCTSSKGIFKTSSGKVLGYTGTLSKSISYSSSRQAYVGTIYEPLSIPLNVIQNALKLNSRKIYYYREFTFSKNNIPPKTVYSVFTIQNEATLPLSINKVTLYFKNKKAEITIKKYEKLQAYVDIYYSGSGILKGYWEVDGQVLAPRIFKSLTAGKNKITISIPDPSQVNTYATGTHFIRFVITSPKPAFDLPKAIYYVSDTKPKKEQTISLFAPQNNKRIKMSSDEPLQFIWKHNKNSYFYLIEFYTPGKSKPIFSAYTKAPAYSMPPYIVKHYFQKGKYFWTVKGFDENSNTIAKSEKRTFIIE